MPSISALVLPSRNRVFDPARFGGLTVAERAVLACHRAGIDHIVVSSDRLDDGGLAGRLARRGVAVTIAHRRRLADMPGGHGLIVVSTDVIFGPQVLEQLVECARGGANRGWCAADAIGGLLAYLPPDVLDEIRDRDGEPRAIFELYRRQRLVLVDVAPLFCRPLPIDGAIWRLERDYIRALTDTEGGFTRAIRLFSAPITQLLVRVHMSANLVTLVGLALALCAALQFAERAPWPGVVGALFYYASVVLKCSGGEVARTTFTDSKFDAWFGTLTDYLPDIFVFGGLVAGELGTYGACPHVNAAAFAALSSVCIVLIGGRVRLTAARAYPGACDDALALALEQGTLARLAVRGRTLITRPFMAHLIVFLALIGHLPALLYVWACGSAAALLVLLAGKGALVRSVRVEAVRGLGAGEV